MQGAYLARCSQEGVGQEDTPKRFSGWSRLWATGAPSPWGPLKSPQNERQSAPPEGETVAFIHPLPAAEGCPWGHSGLGRRTQEERWGAWKHGGTALSACWGLFHLICGCNQSGVWGGHCACYMVSRQSGHARKVDNLRPVGWTLDPSA